VQGQAGGETKAAGNNRVQEGARRAHKPLTRLSSEELIPNHAHGLH